MEKECAPKQTASHLAPPKSATERWDLLAKKLIKAQKAYYLSDQPIMVDAEYDRLIHELRALEDEYPALWKATSPSMKVGAKPTKTGTLQLKHRERMYSLQFSYYLYLPFAYFLLNTDL